MAWRDIRRYKGRMCLFVLSIAIGVAALVALGSFWINVKDAINDQARALLGADLQVQTRQELSPDVHKVLDKIPGDAAVETKISTMAFFPHNNGSRLAQVRAMRGDFPFYGEIVTDPPTAIDTLRSSQTPLAIAEESLLLQFDAAVGEDLDIQVEVDPAEGVAIELSAGEHVRRHHDAVVWVRREVVEDVEPSRVVAGEEERDTVGLEDAFTPVGAVRRPGRDEEAQAAIDVIDQVGVEFVMDRAVVLGRGGTNTRTIFDRHQAPRGERA